MHCSAGVERGSAYEQAVMCRAWKARCMPASTPRQKRRAQSLAVPSRVGVRLSKAAALHQQAAQGGRSVVAGTEAARACDRWPKCPKHRFRPLSLAVQLSSWKTSGSGHFGVWA